VYVNIPTARIRIFVVKAIEPQDSRLNPIFWIAFLTDLACRLTADENLTLGGSTTNLFSDTKTAGRRAIAAGLKSHAEPGCRYDIRPLERPMIIEKF
jgi:hypothetical protein